MEYLYLILQLWYTTISTGFGVVENICCVFNNHRIKNLSFLINSHWKFYFCRFYLLSKQAVLDFIRTIGFCLGIGHIFETHPETLNYDNASSLGFFLRAKNVILGIAKLDLVGFES